MNLSTLSFSSSSVDRWRNVRSTRSGSPGLRASVDLRNSRSLSAENLRPGTDPLVVWPAMSTLRWLLFVCSCYIIDRTPWVLFTPPHPPPPCPPWWSVVCVPQNQTTSNDLNVLHGCYEVQTIETAPQFDDWVSSGNFLLLYNSFYLFIYIYFLSFSNYCSPFFCIWFPDIGKVKKKYFFFSLLQPDIQV